MAGTLPIFKLEEAPELESPTQTSARQSCLVRIYPASASGALTDLRGPRMTIGRDPLCDIELQDDFISRVHALFEEFGQNWLVTDRGSLNGTFVNGTRVDMARLASGDRLRVGRVELIALRDAD